MYQNRKRMKRALLEDHLRKKGLDPKKTISYYCECPFMKRVIDSSSIIKSTWVSSPVCNTHMLDIEIK
jgi:hypothetical protein